ncbi:hypothetical protein EVAR_59558_1 [Eumeta japonica]|uniref:Gustatory receptor n=1 Tax=Eumeta variegata TaxID=151549 RepID=A0A4C1YRM1_EUMVA|nr:hypothetical protein EVAR_59558_1 [Eumeta japonica]
MIIILYLSSTPAANRVEVNIEKQPETLRLCDVSKRCACGLFTVDAALPLRLLGLVATYCIVLLQFAFL